MKYEWKKQDKQWYGAGKNPTLITVPEQRFIAISGSGNPNDQDFSDKVAALYALAYAIKIGYKKDAAQRQNGIEDFSVYPLEGVWDLQSGDTLIKENLEYTIMIRQPDFITEEMAAAALERVKAKKADPLYEKIRFETRQGGKCIEILHIGSYDEEPAAFAKMARFAEEQGLTRTGSSHREIYLNNAKRVETTKLKTILRYPVK